MDRVTLPALTDAHVHLRQGAMTAAVAGHTSRRCAYAVVMPNTLPPVHDEASVSVYRAECAAALGPGCVPLVTAKWLPRTTPGDVAAWKRLGVVGVKLYPAGATTNSQDGILWEDLGPIWASGPAPHLRRVLEAMEWHDLPLLCHGEAPGFVMDREALFLPWLRRVARDHPGLRVTLEHVTTADGVDAVRELAAARPGRVLGTVTLHHLLITLDDVAGGRLRPDLFCMPIPKRPDPDRAALRAAALSGEPCFALGSDSAPHPVASKYCGHGCAGVFTAPVLAEALWQFFDGNHADPAAGLTRFASEAAGRFYGLPPTTRTVTLERRPWSVGAEYGGVVPFLAGEVLPWGMVD